MKKITLSIAFLLIIALTINAQSKPPSNPGSCYAKCIVPNKYKTVKIELPIFTGDESSNVPVEKFVLLTKATRKWEKKSSKEACKSGNSDDVIWCLVEEPEVVEEFIIVKDTADNPYYELRTIEKKELVQAGGFTEWQEVVCSNDITSSLIQKIGHALKNMGYYEGILPTKMTPNLKRSLKKYISDHELPTGSIYNYQVLGELGVVEKRLPKIKKVKNKKRKRRRWFGKAKKRK